LSFLKKIVLFLNVVAALCVIAGAMCIYVNPQELWVIAFFGLLFPYLLLINIFFLFFWVIVRFKYAMVSLTAILITLPVMKTYFAFHFLSPQKTSSSSTIKVMSYNVRNFDLYNWSDNKKTLDKMMELIKEEQPDIACFQEFFNADTGRYQTIKRLLQTAGFKFFFFEKNVSRKNFGEWGVATFSRYPIINHGEIRIADSPLNSSLFTDLQIDSSIVRVFNVHLQSVYLSKQDYEYLDQVSNEQDMQVKPTRQIASKLKHAFLIRAPQSIKMKEEISRSKYPVIVCGDFNDTPASFCYHTVANDLQDAFLSSGWGIAPTYTGLFSAFRIDYILCNRNFLVSKYKTRCEKYSDHYAVTCEISIQ
jgi:endonuclease/exonuclease/phosphatase family metal-dependent hydrolase